LTAFFYGVSVLGYMFKKHGPWPLATWTMLGWTVATVRHLAGALGFGYIQRILTFPSLLANSVTFILWYTLILPGVLVMTPKHNRSRVMNRMVYSLFMFTVHGINLPFSAVDFAWQPTALNDFDLWAGLVYGLLYIFFYLAILDPLGAHLYFILSPRKWWGAGTYLGILALGIGVFKACNGVVGNDVSD